MRDILTAYLAGATTMLGLDFLWLRLMMGPLYRRDLGPILSDKVNMTAALIFYLAYVAGLVFLAVRPALADGDWRTALIQGAVLGCLAYATYDLTNMATLNVWSWRVTVLDIAWGTVLTAIAASISAVVTLKLKG